MQYLLDDIVAENFKLFEKVLERLDHYNLTVKKKENADFSRRNLTSVDIELMGRDYTRPRKR